MASYTPISFAPIVYPDWGDLFDGLPDEQCAQLLKAIARYPEYEPPEGNIAWKFIKGQLDKQYQKFLERSQKAKASRQCGATSVDERRLTSTNEDERQQKLTEVDHKPIPKPIPQPKLKLESSKDIYKQTAEPSAPSHLISQLVDLYNEIASGHFPQMKVLTEKRKKAVKRFADFLRKQTKSADDDALLSEAKSYFLRASRCDFLCGKNDRGWKADFDFLVNENKAVLVLEGKYDNGKSEESDRSQWQVKPQHDWYAEMQQQRKAEKEGLNHADAINIYLRGES